jgi:hypothetical protein
MIEKPYLPHVPTHTQTLIPHIWLVVSTGKYVYEDETNTFDDHQFDNIEAAHQALADYCTYNLQNGRFYLERLLHQPVLAQLESVKAAIDHIAKCEVHKALEVLRADDEEILKYSASLYALITRGTVQ